MTRLTATDAFFAYADSASAPMNMGSVLMLSLPADYKGDFFENFRSFIAARIQYLPKLKKCLAVDPVGLPHWLDCEDFDLDYHIRRSSVPSQDDKTLFRKIGRLQHTPFDMDKPLFMFYVIEGLRDGRIAVVQKFHHAFADGKTAVRIMDLFSDEGLERASFEQEIEDTVSPGRLARGASGYVEELRRTFTSLPGIAGAARRMLGAGGKAMLDRIRSRPRTIFSEPLSDRRLFAFRQWPLEEVNRVRRAAGLTFNDMGLALLGGALKRYLEELEALPAESLVCNVPVALAVKGSGGGNAVLAIWVPLGTDIEDRVQRIQFMKQEVDESKQFLSGVLEGASAGSGIQLPAYLVRAAALQSSTEWITRRMPPPGNIALSNVPAPSQTIHVAGAVVDSLYGMPMVLQGQAVSTTFSSYDDKVVCSMLCCEHALPDPERIYDYMDDELKALAAIYLKPVKKKVAHKVSGKVPHRAKKKERPTTARPSSCSPKSLKK